ncbi:hypothetical protein EK21DRAFT_111394 [Setomelanomma holmii]|uniref:Uncharacterized protein n=1 Tax=Setomelanomma holmii TaxID=210430 RepID=A0A9P4H9S4_9PLEO|nr:hypothetical protein EK21DRAFT_111394 [Setomelanomma holmii]
MDWTSDNACLASNGHDLDVFKYQPRPSRAIKIVQKNNYRAQVWSLQSPDDWANWLANNIDNTDCGLVLMYDRRAFGHIIS